MTSKPIFGGKLTATANDHREKWCVFGHTRDGDPSPVFIGYCPLPDIYSFTECYKHSWWRDNMTGNTQFTVSLLYICDNGRDAERQMIAACDEYRPMGNRLGHLLAGRVIVTCTQGEKAGQTWPSLTDAARECGVTPGAISNHLNLRRGYETVRGMKFVRGFTDAKG